MFYFRSKMGFLYEHDKGNNSQDQPASGFYEYEEAKQ